MHFLEGQLYDGGGFGGHHHLPILLGVTRGAGSAIHAAHSGHTAPRELTRRGLGSGRGRLSGEDGLTVIAKGGARPKLAPTDRAGMRK